MTWVKTYSGGKPNYTEPCERCGEVNPAYIHTCTPMQPEPVATLYGSLPVYDVPTEQEPVAWIHNFIDGGFTKSRPNDLDRYPDRWTALYKDPTPCQTCEALARTVMMDQTSHDTAPPQREWQNLTDEDLDFWGGELGLGELGKGALRAVGAHLKEKNNGNN